MQRRDVDRRRWGLVLEIMVVTLMAGAAMGRAEPPPLPALESTNPLTTGQVRPSGLELEAIDGDGWSFTATSALGNTFTSTHQVGRAHAAVDPAGARLSPAARAYAALHWPEDLIFQLDAEVQVLAIEAAGPIGGALFAGVRVSAWRLGSVGLDAVPEWWHDLLGMDDAGRPLYPRGETTVWVRQPEREVLLERELGVRRGPTSLWLGRDLPPLGPWHHRAWLLVALPGADSSVIGRSGVGWGLRWAGEGQLHPRLTVRAGLGYTDQGGRTLWARRAADTGHGWLGLALDLGRGWGASGLARADTSPVDAAGRLGEPTVELGLGLSRRLTEHLRAELALGEDLPGAGIVPDFSLQLRLLVRP